MLSEKTVKIYTKALAVFMLLVCMFFMMSVPSFADNSEESTDDTSGDVDIAALQQSINEKQDQINALSQERQNLENGKTDVQNVINGLQNSKNELTSYVAELDAELSNMQANIDLYNELIEAKSAEIEASTLELEAAEEMARLQYEAMKTRIRFMYETGDSMYLELLLTAESFGDMLNKADYIEQLSAYDRKMLEQYILVVEYTQQCKEELEAEEAVLLEAQAALEEEMENMNLLIAEKEAQIASYNEDISEQQAVISAFDEELASQDAELEALEAALAADRQALADATAVKYDGGQFTWPAPDYTRISSEFGWRTHPVLGTQKFHSGLDMASPGGSRILAAYDGTVVAAGYSSSMGNYIMIDHGSGLYTVYMHASALYVSAGDYVTAGTKIAAVGSTGMSTGNHLHFSVRLNGEYVNPWNYL